MHFSLALTSSGQVYQWGIVFQEIMPRPTLMYLPSVGRGVTHIACGAKHCVALLDGGAVYSWGCGAFGRLGHGDQLSRSRPAPVSALDLRRTSSADAVVRIAAGGFCSGAVTANGQVYVWGFNRYGQCGTGDCRDVIVPQPMRAASLRGVVPTDLLIARHHTALLSAEGRLYTWGAWTVGRLGHSASVKPVPVSVPEVGQPDVTKGMAVLAPPGAGGSGHVLQLVLYPTAVRGLQHKMIVAAAVGGQHMLAACSDGALFSWGRGSEGALGHGNLLHQRTPRQVEALGGVHITQLSAGAFHSAAVTADGQLFMWGAASSGQLGLPRKLLGLPPASGGAAAEEEEWQRPRAELNIAVPQLVRFGRSGAETRARPRVAVIACGAAHTVALVLHADPAAAGPPRAESGGGGSAAPYNPSSAAAAAAAAAVGSDEEEGEGGDAAPQREQQPAPSWAGALAAAAWEGQQQQQQQQQQHAEVEQPDYDGGAYAERGEYYEGDEYGEYGAADAAYWGGSAQDQHAYGAEQYDAEGYYGGAGVEGAQHYEEHAEYEPRAPPARPRALDMPRYAERGTSAASAAVAGGFIPTDDDVLELFSFTRHNRLKEVQPLLRAGFPVDVRDENGNTPLIVAAQNGLHRMAQLLLRFGADMNAQNVRVRFSAPPRPSRARSRIAPSLPSPSRPTLPSSPPRC
jgi:alpha-tubulin suppressor-like RCC1 family protein